MGDSGCQKKKKMWWALLNWLPVFFISDGSNLGLLPVITQRLVLQHYTYYDEERYGIENNLFWGFLHVVEHNAYELKRLSHCVSITDKRYPMRHTKSVVQIVHYNPRILPQVQHSIA